MLCLSGTSLSFIIGVASLAGSGQHYMLFEDLFATTWRIDRFSQFARFHLTFLDSTASCESVYLTSTDRKNYCGLLFLFPEEISPRKNLCPMKHATEARSRKWRNSPGIWNYRAAKNSTNPDKHSTTVKIRAQRQPSD